MKLRVLFYIFAFFLTLATIAGPGMPPAHAQNVAPLKDQIKNKEPVVRSIILFDQSGSMGRYDPLVISKTWLKTLTHTFEGTYGVMLVGFDSHIHPPVSLTIGPDVDMADIESQLDKIKTRGKVTDMESPFRFLAEMDSINDIDLVLIISDGVPEIWDKKMGYLSPRVLDDPRYENLNSKYQQLATAGAPTSEILKQLGPLYHQKNLSLIDAGLNQLSKEIALKTVVWDISARSDYLRKWSQTIGAEYMAERIVDNEDTVNQLMGALLKLQLKASDLSQEPLPGNEQSRMDAVLSVVQETQRQILAETPPPPPEPEPAPEPVAPKVAEIIPTPAPPRVEPAIVAPVVTMTPPRVDVGSENMDKYGKLIAAGVLIIGFILLSASFSWLLGRGRRTPA